MKSVVCCFIVHKSNLITSICSTAYGNVDLVHRITTCFLLHEFGVNTATLCKSLLLRVFVTVGPSIFKGPSGHSQQFGHFNCTFVCPTHSTCSCR